MEPKIRFKGFEGEYCQNYYSQLFNKINDTSHNVASDKYCKRGTYPVIDQSKEFIVGYTDIVKPIIPEKGIIVFGDHTRELKYIDFPFCTGADGTQLLAPKTTNDPKYLFYLCKSLYIPNTGYNRHLKYLKESNFNIPSSKTEQQAIAFYFTSLDSQISACTSRLASLKQMKAASLQAMFPQEGETVPKIRFKGFEGEWKKVSFKDFTFHAGAKNRDNLPLESYSISNEFGFIPQNEQFENGGTMTQADKRMYYIVSPNSFAYNPARINVGSLGYYEGNEDVIVSSLYEVFKTDDTICDRFLLYWFKTNIFQKMIEQFQEGGVRLYFFYDKMCKCSLKRPSLAEQQAIASYFTSLDHQIFLQTQRLEKLKQIKSACLDKMFV